MSGASSATGPRYGDGTATRDRVLLLTPTNTYKAADFLAAAAGLRVDVVVGTDRHQAMASDVPDRTLTFDFRRPDEAAARIVELHARRPIHGIVATDDESVVLASVAGARIGLPVNDPDAARASRDKRTTRERLAEAGMRTPSWVALPVARRPEPAAREVRYPCVLKPLFLNASRGVIRANDPMEFVAAFERIRSLLQRPAVRKALVEQGSLAARSILVEDYLPGDEVSVEGLLVDGRLQVLALFDKPDTPEGPTFEETLFVTPSSLAPDVQAAVVAEVGGACEALGLHEGPVHAELRVRDGVPWILEVAARTIGGLCARALRFGAGISLEEVVLRHALGLPLDGIVREVGASGVLMLPVPRAGRLREVRGVDAARAIEGIGDVRITVERGGAIEPAPDGNRYLGFVFARGAMPGDVERALRAAQSRLTIEIDPA